MPSRWFARFGKTCRKQNWFCKGSEFHGGWGGMVTIVILPVAVAVDAIISVQNATPELSCSCSGRLKSLSPLSFSFQCLLGDFRCYIIKQWRWLQFNQNT